MQSIFIAPQLYAVCVPQVGVFVSEFKEKQLGKFDEVNDHVWEGIGELKLGEVERFAEYSESTQADLAVPANTVIVRIA